MLRHHDASSPLKMSSVPLPWLHVESMIATRSTRCCSSACLTPDGDVIEEANPWRGCASREWPGGSHRAKSAVGPPPITRSVASTRRPPREAPHPRCAGTSRYRDEVHDPAPRGGLAIVRCIRWMHPGELAHLGRGASGARAVGETRGDEVVFDRRRSPRRALRVVAAMSCPVQSACVINAVA